MGIRGNEEADKAAKQAMHMPVMTLTRLPHIDYYLIIRRARNCKWQRTKEWESPHNSCRQYEVKLSRIPIGHIRLTHGHLMSRNEQPPT